MPGNDQYEARVTPEVQAGGEMPMAYTPQSLGAGVGQAFQNLGEVATDLHREAVHHADQTAMIDADNQVQSFLNARLYDPKSGVLQQNLGKDAPAAADQTLSDFDSHAAQVSNGLTSPRQKAAFQRMSQTRRFDLQRQLDQYEHVETTRYANEVDKASIAHAATAAVNNATDPEVVWQNIDLQKAVIADAGKRNRMAPEAIAEQQAEASSATHLGVLDKLVSTGQDRQAKAWYDAHKDELVADDSVRAAKLVQAGSTAGEAQRIVDGLSSLSEQDAQKRIDQIDDVRLRDEAQRRADQLFAHRQQAENRAQKAAFHDAYGIAQDSEMGLADPKVVALMATMEPSQQEWLKTAVIRDVRDPAETRRLSVLAAQDPDAFLKVMQDPTLVAKVGKPSFTQLSAYEKEIREKGSVSNAAGIRGRAETIDDALVSAGFGHENKATGMTQVDRNSPGAKAFMDGLDDRVTNREQALGRALTPKEIKEEADHMVIGAAVAPAGTLWGYKAERPAYALTAEERAGASKDLAAYTKLNPDEGTRAANDIDRHAQSFGNYGLSADQRNRAFAQAMIGRDAQAAGDVEAYQQAKARYQEILREKATAPPRSDHADVLMLESRPGRPFAPDG